MVAEAELWREGAAARAPEAHDAAGAEAGPRLYLTCTMAGGRYLVPTAGVREVEEVGATTPVPTTPPWLRGVMNLRGQIVGVVDLAHFLDLAAEPGAGAEALICVIDDDLTLALAVDAVSTIRSLAPADIMSLPDGAADAGRATGRYLAGLYRAAPGDADGLLGVLDLATLLRGLVAERLTGLG